MKKKFLIGPIPIFIISIIAIGGALWTSIHSSLEFDQRWQLAMEKFQLKDKILVDGESWSSLILLIIFFVIIIAGIAAIFVYYQKLQKLYKLQENFISNFTHELKTPVASIKLYLETMNKRDLSPAQMNEFIGYMLRDTERLHLNINQILEASRLESGKDDSRFENVEVRNYAEELIKKISYLFPGQVHYECKLTKDIYCKVDPVLMESVFINLISNGLKYNDNNNPQVQVNLRSSFSTIRFEVRDNGIGLDKKYLKKVFKKFFRVGDIFNNKIKGTGLGLYLVNQIITIHKGKIRFESEGIGTGSLVTFELPRLYPAPLRQFKKEVIN